MAEPSLKLGEGRLLSGGEMAALPSERERREIDHGSAVHAEIRVSKREQIRL
jgi:hypothetical protein